MDNEKQLYRIINLTKEMLLKYSAIIDSEQNQGIEFFKNGKLSMFNLVIMQYPILICKSLADLFQTSTDDEALKKANNMTDVQICNLIQRQLMHKIENALDNCWLDKALTKIVESKRSSDTKVRLIKETIDLKYTFDKFIKRYKKESRNKK